MTLQIIDKRQLADLRKSSTIFISNKLLAAIFKMSLPERRVLWFVIRDYDPEENKVITVDNQINHREYADLYQISIQQASREIGQACNSLPENAFFIPRPEWENNILEELDQRIFTREELTAYKPFSKGNMVESCDFGIKVGMSQVIFTKTFLALTLPVKNYMTQYRLYDADCLSNASHIALYEDLKLRYSDALEQGVVSSDGSPLCVEVTPNYLATKLLLPKSYEQYAQMRRGFIAPALKAINKNTDITVELQEIRVDDSPRAKIVSLHFNISRG